MINDIEISIPTLRRVFSDALSKLEDMFFKDIMFLDNIHDGIIPINLGSVLDDKDNKNALEDMATISNLKNFKHTLIKRARDEKTSLYAFFNKGKLENNITRYFQRVSRFLELLALNIYVLSSSPLREQALVLIKFRNSTVGTLRSIFLDRTTLQIAIDTTNLSKQRDSAWETNSNIRFLPLRLSTLIAYYIALVAPLVEYLSMKHLKKETLEVKLFKGPNLKQLTSEKFSKALRQLTGKF